MLLQTPNLSFLDGAQKYPVFGMSRPAPLQRMPASYTLPEFITSEATCMHSFTRFTSTSEAWQVYLWNKLCIKERLNSWLQIKFWKGNKKQQKQLPAYLSLWDFSGAQKLRKAISSALLLQCYLKESASLLRSCPPLTVTVVVLPLECKWSIK